MNEEFAITLKTVLDNSSIAEVKRQINDLKDSIQKSVNVTLSGARSASAGSRRSTATSAISQDLKEAQERAAYIQESIESIENLLKRSANIGEEGIKGWEKRLAILRGRLEETKRDIEEMTRAPLEQKFEKAEEPVKKIQENIKVVQKSTIKMNLGFKNIFKSITRIGMALLGVRGVYGAISRAMRTYLGQNEELQQKLNACWYALGSMFAPVLEKIINGFVYLVSLVDALAKSLGFAGVNMSKYGKAGAKASKQLAGFDEINNINSQSGSGAGDFKLKDVDDQALQKFKTILTLVAGIAAGLAAWKIASSFMDALGLTMQQCIGIGLAIGGATVYVLAFIDAWKNGLNWDNLRLMLLGLAVAVTGIGLAFGPVGAAITLLIGGIGFLVIGIREFIKTGEVSQETCMAIMLGIGAIGTAIGLLIGGPLGALIGMVIGTIIGSVVPLVLKNWDKIKEKINDFKQHFSNFVNTTLPELANKALSKVTELKDKLVSKFQEIITKIKEKVEAFKTWWQNLSLGSFKIKMPHFRVSGSFGWSWDGGIQLPHISVDWYAKGGVFSGPQVIGVGEYSGASSNPEVVAPLNTLANMIGDNQRTEELLEELITVVSSKEFKAYISQREVGEASVKYINQQSRIMGGSIV